MSTCQTILFDSFSSLLSAIPNQTGQVAKPCRVVAAARSSPKAAVQAWPRQSSHQEDLKLIKYVSDRHVPQYGTAGLAQALTFHRT